MITPDERQRGTEGNLPPPLYGLVLAGAGNNRAGTGQEQILRAYGILDEHCELAFISSRQESAGITERIRGPQIMDSYDDSGPMIGILSALRACPGAAWLVLACNRPQFDIGTIAHLIVNRNPEQAITAYISATDGLPEPLCAIYEPRSRELLLGCAHKEITCVRRALVHLEPHVELLAPLKPPATDEAGKMNA